MEFATSEPYVMQKFPLHDVEGGSLPHNIIKAETALTNFNDLLEAIQNTLMPLDALVTRDAVSSFRIEGTRALFSDILEYDTPKRVIGNLNDFEEAINQRNAFKYA